MPKALITTVPFGDKNHLPDLDTHLKNKNEDYVVLGSVTSK